MDRIIERVKKLLEHERSAREIGSKAEAEAFAGRVQEMLNKHKLSMSEVEAETLDTEDPIGYCTVKTKAQRTEKWRKLLAAGIGMSLFCKVLELRGGGLATEFTFIGRESDRTAAANMYIRLSEIAPKLARGLVQRIAPTVEQVVDHFASQGRRRDYTIAKKLHAKASKIAERDFLVGFVAGICKRLESGRKFLDSGSNEAAKGLILRDQRAIETFAYEHFSMKKEFALPIPEIRLPFAMEAGYQAGMAVDIAARPMLHNGD